MTFRRTLQFFSLTLFLLFLLAAVSSGFAMLPLDAFLRLDPVLFAGTAISARTFFIAFLPAVIILALAPVLGRFFCGNICPMGVTLDISDSFLTNPKNKTVILKKFKSVKHWVMLFVIGSSLVGVSWVFIASPLALITRFYGLLIQPALAFIMSAVLRIAEPLASAMSIDSLSFVQIDQPRFATQFFILAFFILLFAAARLSPRFWCRYLCPSGSLLAFLSIKPLFRRSVSSDCTDCGKCIRSCRMDAIPADDARLTEFSECILCRQCEDVCPTNAVSFTYKREPEPAKTLAFPLSRRAFIYSGLAGAGFAVTNLTGLKSVYGKPGAGHFNAPGLVRPPGALPERAFLAECVRCGECAAACPTNTIQPIWGQAGAMGLFSPAINARRAGCDPECNRCGLVCPTEAIADLPVDQRIWAKVGTAVIYRQKCLAWEHQKKCLVCDEVCPFDAVEFRPDPGNPVAVPHVIENKCSGCGYCEHHCPVNNESAIVITPMAALRLTHKNYRHEARRRGLKFILRTKGSYGLGVAQDQTPSGPAPGFTD